MIRAIRTAMLKRLLMVGLGAAAVAAVPAEAAAQQGPPARVILAPADIAFPPPTDMDFRIGWVDHGGVSVSVEPSGSDLQNWQLFVRASAADMGGYGKPVRDILVRAQGSTVWTPLEATAPILVAEGAGRRTVTVYLRLLLDLALDSPGLYSVPLEYSATSF